MLAIRKGHRVDEFADAVGEWADRTVCSNEWQQLVLTGSLTLVWEYINSEIRGIALSLFPAERRLGPKYADDKKEVNALLAQRRDRYFRNCQLH